jgi:hypothetical protein
MKLMIGVTAATINENSNAKAIPTIYFCSSKPDVGIAAVYMHLL